MTGEETIVQGWFAVTALEPGVWCIEEPFHEERVKSFLVAGTGRAALIDTGMGVGDIRAVVDDLTSLPVMIVNSHAHWDHVGGNWRFDEIAIHPAEADDLLPGVGTERLARWFAPEHLSGPLPPGIDPRTLTIPPSRATRLIEDGDQIELGERTLEVLHLPGHSPGGVALFDRAAGALFSTDVAYGGALYAQMAQANLADYQRSLRRLADLAPSIANVYPSHGPRRIAPSLLPAMSAALDEVIAGRGADAIEDGVASHQFDGFSILVAAGERVGRTGA